MLKHAQGIAMPENGTSRSCILTQSGNGRAFQPLRLLASKEPQPDLDIAPDDKQERSDLVTVNLIEMAKSQLYSLISRSLASLRLYDWTPTGWMEVESWSK